MQNNEVIKKKIRNHGIPQWRLAKEVGISENTIGRYLRTELSEETFAEYMAAISRILKEREDE